MNGCVRDLYLHSFLYIISCYYYTVFCPLYMQCTAAVMSMLELLLTPLLLTFRNNCKFCDSQQPISHCRHISFKARNSVVVAVVTVMTQGFRQLTGKSLLLQQI